MSRKEVLSAASRLNKKYPVKDLPYLIFYRLENGIIKEMPGDYNFFGGIANLYKLKYWIREYGDMPKALFRSLSQDQSPETKKLPFRGELLNSKY